MPAADLSNSSYESEDDSTSSSSSEDEDVVSQPGASAAIPRLVSFSTLSRSPRRARLPPCVFGDLRAFMVICRVRTSLGQDVLPPAAKKASLQATV